MVRFKCGCGGVSFEFTCGVEGSASFDEPSVVFFCHCSMCCDGEGEPERGVAWGAIPRLGSYPISGTLNRRKSSFATRSFCKSCGTEVLLRYDCEIGTDWIRLDGVEGGAYLSEERQRSAFHIHCKDADTRAILTTGNATYPAKMFDAWEPWIPDPSRKLGVPASSICYACFKIYNDCKCEVPAKRTMPHACDNPRCASGASAKLVCSICKRRRYCSSKCARVHWKNEGRGHRFECGPSHATSDNEYNKRISQFSVVVERKTGRGRCVSASSALQAGSVVLRQAPLAKLLHPWLWDSHCFLCFKRLPSARESCVVVGESIRYCSTNCLESESKVDKKFEHSFLDALVSVVERVEGLNRMMLSDILLAARVLRRSNKKEFADFIAMEFHDASADREQQYSLMAKILLQSSLLGRPNRARQFSEEFAVTVFKRFTSNNFAVTDSLLVSVGAAVIPEAALLNHSCLPNCVATWSDAGQLTFRLIVDVPAGTELTHSYIEAACAAKGRQEILRQDYAFQCACDLCVSPPDVVIPKCLVFKKGQSIEATRNIETCFKNPTTKSIIRAVRDATEMANMAMHSATSIEAELSILSSSLAILRSHLCPCHPECISVVGKLLTTALAAGQYERAIVACAELVEMYRIVYPFRHPLLGLQLYTLGNLHADRGEFARALPILQEALQILRITHGLSCALVHGLLQLVSACERSDNG